MGKLTGIQYGGFQTVDGGVDEYHDSAMIGNNRLQSAMNIHIDGGKVIPRPGRKLWCSAFDDVFQGVTRYIDEDGVSRVVVASGGVLWEVDGNTKSSLGEVAREALSFHTLRGRCFLNGSETQKKLRRGVLSNIGLSAPDTAPVAADGGVGALTGSYAYRVTFGIVDSDGNLEYESNPSPVSNSISISSRKVALTIPVSGDSRVNARYIYRTSASGAKYYEEGEVLDNSTTTWESSSVSDAALGDEVEYTHGVPVFASVAEGCNERQFWMIGSELYYSEAAHTNAYLEYQKSTSRYSLPNAGRGVGMRRLYNPNTGREDLYVFQESAINILFGGDPNQPLYSLTRNIGLKSNSTIVEYNGALHFLTNKGTIGAVTGGRYIDVSTRNCGKSIKALLSQENCHAALIFDHYYAITGRNTASKLYNTVVWVCDLRTATEVQNGMMDAVWYPWQMDAEYLLQLDNNTVLAFDNRSRAVFALSFEYKRDEDVNGAKSPIEWNLRVKNWFGDSLYVLKQPRMLAIKGRFQRSFSVIPYAWSSKSQQEMEYSPVEAAATLPAHTPFATTTLRDQLVAPFPSTVVGNTFSFKIVGNTEDHFAEIMGYELTYNAFGARI
jgi:hypothetical protein